jgi:SAM-dependent methyltransferase
VANEAEARRWNDERWATAWPKRERLTETVSPYLLRHVAARPGQRVCDVGCGGGGLTIELANAVSPGGAALGVDLSAPLLDLARRRAAEAGSPAEFVQLDVQVDALDQDPYDTVVSQFGVMFFDEPTKALGRIRRLAVDGGRLVFACWQGVERNPWHIGTALRPLAPRPPTPPPGKSPVGPFAFGDEEYVDELLEGAGFVGVSCTPYETHVRTPASAVFDRTLLPLMGIGPDREAEALALVERHLQRFAVGEDEYEYPLAFFVFVAVNP